MKAFTIKLKHFQGEYFREAWTQSEDCGDCEIVGRYEPKIRFTDYEGAQGTLGRIERIPVHTGAQVRSLRAIRRKIDAGVVSAVRGVK